MYELTYLELFN